MASRPDQLERAAAPVPEPAWDDLRVFLAVVAHGSLNGAATALGQSQPTVARRVRALEGFVGTPLFARGPNRLVLTEAGRAILEAASPMSEAAAAAARMALAYRPRADAPVRLTATASVTMFLSLHSPALAQAAAPAALALIPTRRRLDLAAGEADIALRMRNLPENPDLVARRLGRIAFTIYEHRDGASGAVIAPPEDPDLSLQAAFVARATPGRPIAARIGDMPSRHHAARARLGAACLPCWLGDSDADLVRLAGVEEVIAEDIFLVMLARGRRRREVTRVGEALVALFAEHGEALAGQNYSRGNSRPISR